MTVVQRVAKPQYVLRPDQVVRRLLFARSRPSPRSVRVAWGDRMLVRADTIGDGITRMGVHELAVSEVVWRLGRGCDLVLDIGANAGYFSLLLARGAREVVAFEPNPRLLPTLEANVAGLPQVTVRAAAVSDRSGHATLTLPDEFASNSGLATLEAGAGERVDVPTVTVDEAFGERAIDLVKIDVEGHEAAALAGAASALDAGRIRDVVFEDLDRETSPVAATLAAAGYAIFAIQETFRGPRLASANARVGGWDAPTYLATRDPSRAHRLMEPNGWHCLRPLRPHLRPRGRPRAPSTPT